MIETTTQPWLALQIVNLTIQDFTQEIAVLTTQVSALVLALAAASYAIGVALVATPVVHWWPSIGEHGVRIKNDAIRAIFHISIYAAITNAVVWGVALINKIG
ncbi:MAG: hypothetical protein QXY90_04885 [Candidatus Anstonellales archaeon]